MLSWLRGYYAILDLPAGDPTGAHGRYHDRYPGLGLDLDEIDRRADQLLQAKPCCLQLRAKALTTAALRDAARMLGARCRSAVIPFCVNDRLDVALLVGADVVHLGQEDLPLAEARRIAAGRLLIGYSTHAPDQAAAAVAAGADYIGFGPVFDTRSKRQPDPTVGLKALRAVCARVPIPVVAIGGIALDRVDEVAATGAAAAAVISAVAESPDPAAAGRLVAEAFARRLAPAS
jgi:thiamine-phosphate pyrophosphorylase